MFPLSAGTAGMFGTVARIFQNEAVTSPLPQVINPPKFSKFLLFKYIFPHLGDTQSIKHLEQPFSPVLPILPQFPRWEGKFNI